MPHAHSFFDAALRGGVTLQKARATLGSREVTTGATKNFPKDTSLHSHYSL